MCKLKGPEINKATHTQMVTNGPSTRPSLTGCPLYISILDDTPTSSQDQILGTKQGSQGGPLRKALPVRGD